MTKTLKITLPDSLEQSLAEAAAKANQSTEEWILQLLIQNQTFQESALIASASLDPLLQLAGCIDVNISDAAENHDQYIGQALYDEMHQND
ncbi:hypothetical protein [Almyronema epifaneia]|uniref:CopG-like ribbon-helix-helix domain-containing protein n=1 Tax=Almyronema epifaneia S1 TaxID=2991925 RepID=A0ABW6IA68_9CYAN